MSFHYGFRSRRNFKKNAKEVLRRLGIETSRRDMLGYNINFMYLFSMGIDDQYFFGVVTIL